MSNILPLFDPELDISSLNVFQTFQIQPYEHQLIDRSSKSNGTTIQNNNNNNKSNNNIPLNSTKNNTTPTKDNNNDLYCKACKKKFNNEATMQNHLKSAKHVAAVKKASGGAGGKKSTKQPVIKDENQKNEIKNPATAEALQKLEAVSKLNHASAVVSYMDLSKEFYLQKHPLYTAMSLLEIIKLKQNDDIHWKARLYLARLYCIYDKSMEMAYDQYLLILEERHYINKQTLLNLAQSLDKMSIGTLINKCEQLIGQSKELPLSLSFLEESAHAFAQINTTVTGIHNLSEKFSILLYILAYKIQEDKQRCYSYCSMISMVFDRLNLTYRSVDFHLYYVDHLTHISTSSLDVMKLLFINLLKAVEIDDCWRIAEIHKRIKLIDDVIYPEIEILSKISKARCNLDYCSLENELKYEMENLQLLAHSNDSSLLLETMEKKLKDAYLIRLQRCLKL